MFPTIVPLILTFEFLEKLLGLYGEPLHPFCSVGSVSLRPWFLLKCSMRQLVTQGLLWTGDVKNTLKRRFSIPGRMFFLFSFRSLFPASSTRSSEQQQANWNSVAFLAL